MAVGETSTGKASRRIVSAGGGRRRPSSVSREVSVVEADLEPDLELEVVPEGVEVVVPVAEVEPATHEAVPRPRSRPRSNREWSPLLASMTPSSASRRRGGVDRAPASNITRPRTFAGGGLRC